MAHPAPPTPATGAIPLPTLILTYLQKYQGQGDVLAGRYHEFLAPYTPDSGRTHAQLETRIVSMTAEVPKVFLGLVGHAGVTSSITLHRPTRYASHPRGHFGLGWSSAGLCWGRPGRESHRDRPCTRECLRGGTQQRRAHHRGASGTAGGTTRRGAIWPIRRCYAGYTTCRGPEHGASSAGLRASCPGQGTQPAGALGASGRCHHQRWARNGVRGTARLAPLRAHATTRPRWHAYGLTTGVLPQSHRNSPPHTPSRRTAPKPLIGAYCFKTYRRLTHHTWPRRTKWCTCSRRSGMNKLPRG